MLITVKATRTDGRVVLYENYPDHPGGVAWVSGNGRVSTVALTPGVQRQLHAGELIRVEGPSEAKSPTQPVSAPFGGYDEMTAAQVLALMPDMDADEWAAVVAYEAAHKARKSILEA